MLVEQVRILLVREAIIILSELTEELNQVFRDSVDVEKGRDGGGGAGSQACWLFPWLELPQLEEVTQALGCQFGEHHNWSLY